MSATTPNAAPFFAVNLARANVEGQVMLHGAWATRGVVDALARCGISREAALAALDAIKADPEWFNAYRETCVDRA